MSTGQYLSFTFPLRWSISRTAFFPSPHPMSIMLMLSVPIFPINSEMLLLIRSISFWITSDWYSFESSRSRNDCACSGFRYQSFESAMFQIRVLPSREYPRLISSRKIKSLICWPFFSAMSLDGIVCFYVFRINY